MKLITLKSHLQEDCIMRKSVLMKKNKARPNFDIVHKWNKIFKVKKKKKICPPRFRGKIFCTALSPRPDQDVPDKPQNPESRFQLSRK